jgi:hypothetical protein
VTVRKAGNISNLPRRVLLPEVCSSIIPEDSCIAHTNETERSLTFERNGVGAAILDPGFRDNTRDPTQRTGS